MRYSLFIFLMLHSLAVLAVEQVICEPVMLKSQNKNIVLPGVEQSRMMQVYFFKNISAHSIWLDHPEHRSANAGWSSYLRPGHSSALLVNRKNFSMSCAVIKPGKVEYLDCAKEIILCTPKEVTMTTKPRKGTYWLVEDKAWDDLIKSLAKRGVEIK
ncbi:MAG: hypothetical protein ACD_45C00118G0005 [uncultured bacterium]|nr:MAG: hypothetical protein ACD_45C00118G0005 [uncultured bacterium]